MIMQSLSVSFLQGDSGTVVEVRTCMLVFQVVQRMCETHHVCK